MGRLGARAVDKRMRFVTAAETSEETMTAVCRRFGLSRKTGYKWLERYRLDGTQRPIAGAALASAGGKPPRSPNAAWRCGGRIGAGVRSRCALGSSATIPRWYGRRQAR